MNPYSYDDIARYAENDMTAEERQAFEQALQTDTALQEQLNLYRDVHDSLKHNFQKSDQQLGLEATLQQMRGEFFNKQSSTAKVVSINRYLKYAMGVAAVLLIAVFLWKPWQGDLYEQYSEIKMLDPTERGNSDSLLQKASIEFNDGHFGNASLYLNEARKQRPYDSFTEFYLGVSELKKGVPSQAKKVLEPLYNGESVYKYEAAFYMALCYLKEENKIACREWLQKIPVDAANYSKAQELLKKL